MTSTKISDGHFVAIRKWLGLTQTEMAQILGVSLPSVNRWENGRAEAGGTVVEVYKALAKAKRLHVAVLLMAGGELLPAGLALRNIFAAAYGKGRMT